MKKQNICLTSKAMFLTCNCEWQ